MIRLMAARKWQGVTESLNLCLSQAKKVTTPQTTILPTSTIGPPGPNPGPLGIGGKMKQNSLKTPIVFGLLALETGDLLKKTLTAVFPGIINLIRK